MRVTRKMLRNQVLQLNYVLGRPLRAWSFHTEAGNEGWKNKPPSVRNSANPNDRPYKAGAWLANIGHIQLGTWSPGDGWTRFQLAELVSKGGGESNIGPCLTGQEMWAFLQGIWLLKDGRIPPLNYVPILSDHNDTRCPECHQPIEYRRPEHKYYHVGQGIGGGNGECWVSNEELEVLMSARAHLR